MINVYVLDRIPALSSTFYLSLEAQESKFAAGKTSHRVICKEQDACNVVQVTLRNAYKQRKVLLDADAMAIVGEAVFKTLSQHERMAINYAAEHSAISVSDLQRLTQKTWHASKKILENLKSRGIFEDNRRAALKVDPQARYSLKKR